MRLGGTASIQTAAPVLRSAGHVSPRITEDTLATVPRGKTRTTAVSGQPSKVQTADTGKARSFFCVDSGGLILTCTSRIRNGVPTRTALGPPICITMQTRDNKRVRLLPGAALDALDNDLLIRCASYLDADGLAQLGRTSARFGIPQAGKQRSLANEAAHQRFRQSATDEEKNRLPKYGDESDIGLYRSLESLRKPLCFEMLVGDGFGPQEQPASVTHTGRRISTAMSGHVMRGGRHFVEFEITRDEQGSQYICLGVMRPVSLTNDMDLNTDWGGQVNPVAVSSSFKPAVSEKLRSQRTPWWGDSNIHCCTYYCNTGDCCWTDWDNESRSFAWRGSEGLRESGTIGLLLDLDEGTLSVFKNGRFLGVMKEGLDGEYSWFVTVVSSCTISISRGTAPN